MPEVRERRRDRHRVSDMGFQVTDDRSKNSAFSHRLTLDLWFARDNRFLMTAPPFLSRHELSVERKSYHRSCWTELTCQGTLLPDSGSKFMKETPSGTGRKKPFCQVRKVWTETQAMNLPNSVPRSCSWHALSIGTSFHSA